MATRCVPCIHSIARAGWRPLCAVALTLIVAVIAAIPHDAPAKAPPLATAVFDAEALAAPDYDAAPAAVIPQGAEVELTGDVAPGSLVCITTGKPFGFPRSTWQPAFGRVSTPA